jgi:hypothetical protein
MPIANAGPFSNARRCYVIWFYPARSDYWFFHNAEAAAAEVCPALGVSLTRKAGDQVRVVLCQVHDDEAGARGES